MNLSDFIGWTLYVSIALFGLASTAWIIVRAYDWLRDREYARWIKIMMLVIISVATFRDLWLVIDVYLGLRFVLRQAKRQMSHISAA